MDALAVSADADVAAVANPWRAAVRAVGRMGARAANAAEEAEARRANPAAWVGLRPRHRRSSAEEDDGPKRCILLMVLVVEMVCG